MAIQRIVKMTFKPEKCTDFEMFFSEIMERIAEQPGCFGVKLLRDKEDSGIFFTYSVWKDQDSLNAYRNTELFGKVWPTVKEWFAAKPEAWSTEIVHQTKEL